MSGSAVSHAFAEQAPECRQPKPVGWYVVQTRYRFEKKVAEQLRKNGVETFLPLRRELHRWSDRYKDIEVPLFPGYVFVRTDQSVDSRMMVLQTGGMIGFVNFHGEALPVPARQIEQLRMLLAQKVPCSLYPFLKVGRRVRIRGGCLDGLEGILACNKKSSLVVSVDSIRHSIAVEIEGYELEPV
jgi:transcription termination/antitermination protein NusG